MRIDPTAITASTQVSYPEGGLSGSSPVLAALPLAKERIGLVTAATPFHPLDHTWPDQPADTGTVEIDGQALPVVDCVTGAVEDGGDTLHLGADIPVRRGSGGWHWLVVHLADPAAGLDPTALPGRQAMLSVDPRRRRALSAGHTGCHLAALALNAALADRWRKATATDTLGHPDFDHAAITESRIEPHASRDDYRLGKSLRRKGFVADELAAALPEVTLHVNALLAGWVAADAPVGVQAPGPELTARRTWHCALPEGEAHIPCGGTHLTRTGQLGHATATLELSIDGTTLTMRTATG